MSDPNVFSDGWEYERGEPFALRAARVGAAAGARRLGATVYEIDPGGAVSPYHLHHGNEEMLVVLAGRPTLREPSGLRELEAGAVVAFPAGPDGAHRVLNRSDEPARVLIVSEMHFPEVAEYPDTGATLSRSGLGVARVFPNGTDVDLDDAVVRGMLAATEREQD